jgi:hypothetical protein
VARSPAGTTPKACLEPSKNWLVRSAEDATIGSLSGRLFRTSDAWAGGGQEGDMYRVFHNNACYQMVIEEATRDPGGFDPGKFKEFTKRDQAEVRAHLKQPLDSFAFLK